MENSNMSSPNRASRFGEFGRSETRIQKGTNRGKNNPKTIAALRSKENDKDEIKGAIK
jgi:hypothetical protein